MDRRLHDRDRRAHSRRTLADVDPWWDETADGCPAREIDRATWTDRLTAAGDPPPPWMAPRGRRPAERTAETLRWVALVLLLGGIATLTCVLSLGGLQ